jgi:hypothetical protein
MNREIGIPAHDDGFDLAHEKTFAADLRQRSVLNPVSLGSHRDLLKDEIRKVEA